MLFLFFYENQFAQIGSTIPPSRRVDWSTVGYNRNLDNIPTTYDYLYLMPSPSDSPSVNSANIETALKLAESKFGLICIQFRDGIYTINSPIILGGYSRTNIVLKGMGPELTTESVYHHTNYDTTMKYSAYLSDISYYRSSKPNFISQKITWPPIGCPITKSSHLSSQIIPAQKMKIEPGQTKK